MSISYGECESEKGTTQNAAYVSAYEQAVTQFLYLWPQETKG
jgi:hypothetical protein